MNRLARWYAWLVVIVPIIATAAYITAAGLNRLDTYLVCCGVALFAASPTCATRMMVAVDAEVGHA